MNFECIQMTINDDPNFGCTIEFCDTIENYNENLTIEEQLKHAGKYLLIQRSYPEDEYENDWYLIETSEAEIDYGEQDKMYVKHSRNEFEIYCAGVTVLIGLNLSDKEHLKLNRTLKTRFKNQVVILEYDLP